MNAADISGSLASRRSIDHALNLMVSTLMNHDYFCSQITERVTAALEDGIDCSRVRFVHGDACSLPSGLGLGSFDAVLVSNVMDRVPDPQRLLKQVSDALRSGGVALLSSPFRCECDALRFCSSASRAG